MVDTPTVKRLKYFESKNIHYNEGNFLVCEIQLPNIFYNKKEFFQKAESKGWKAFTRIMHGAIPPDSQIISKTLHADQTEEMDNAIKAIARTLKSLGISDDGMIIFLHRDSQRSSIIDLDFNIDVGNLPGVSLVGIIDPENINKVYLKLEEYTKKYCEGIKVLNVPPITGHSTDGYEKFIGPFGIRVYQDYDDQTSEHGIIICAYDDGIPYGQRIVLSIIFGKLISEWFLVDPSISKQQVLHTFKEQNLV